MMKTASLTVLLASAASASATSEAEASKVLIKPLTAWLLAPVSFLANGSGEKLLPGGAEDQCAAEETGLAGCFGTNKYSGKDAKSFGKCLSDISKDAECGAGCDIFAGCADDHVPACADELNAWVNCLSEQSTKKGEEACTCAASKAHALPAMMRGFVPKPKLDIKDQLKAKKDPSVEVANREEEGSAKSRDVPTTVACVVIPTTRRGRRAFLGDRQCENFCSRESYDGHAFKDFFGSDTDESGTSLLTSADCLCFESSQFTELSIASLTKTSEDLGVFPCPTLLSSTSNSAEEGAAVEEE